jgi:acetolactate synthase-1/2/3 large subunit
MNGGHLIASVLAAQRVPFLFTLCGGHISPILVEAKKLGIRVVDTRHEATAVFAADAVARLTGRPAVAAVTAGPGVTNTVTAVKNAQMAQSPVILIGGAAPTALKGRGALQDIEQIGLLKSVVKWSRREKRVAGLVLVMEEAFRKAQEGTPGPVFVEIPVDLLYDEKTVKEWYCADRGGKTFLDKALKWYLKQHVNRLFRDAWERKAGGFIEIPPATPSSSSVEQVIQVLKKAKRPVLITGSQTTQQAGEADQLAAAVERLGIPTYLSGMARGMLGRNHPLHLRHKRRNALKKADFVLLAGVPTDFRLDYGNHIRRSSTYVSVNRSRSDLYKNRKPNVAIHADPGLLLRLVSEKFSPPTEWQNWLAELRETNIACDAEILEQAAVDSELVNPLHFFTEMEKTLGNDCLLVADGGDFVGTASYILQPPGPLTWLDPGAFGTLDVGAGFALGAKLVHPDRDVWIVFGDGSVGYLMTEFDTFVRHGIPVIAVVGNDAGWTQIAREQVVMLGDDVGTVLSRAEYHRVAEGFGGAGFLLKNQGETGEILTKGKMAAREGKPVLVNVWLDKTDFRKGSISM